MGADLYLPSVYDPNYRQWEPLFNEAVAKRDSHKRGTPEYERAQERVLECYQAMYSAGYFRDPYNSWEVLAKFGLSWWDDVIPLLTDEGLLPPERAQGLLERLDARYGEFEDNLAQCDPPDHAYFVEQWLALEKFLRQAISLGEAIRCSL